MEECLICKKKLEKVGDRYICKACNKQYRKKACCPIDNSELEKLAACGSVSYWCNKCNELKSRKDIIYILEEV